MMITSNIKLQMPRFLGICFIMSALIFGYTSCDKPEPVEPDEELCDECGKYPCECEGESTADSTEYKIRFVAAPSYEVPAEGETITVKFTCDGPWSIDIPEKYQEWISADPASGEPSEERQSFNIIVGKNTGSQRTATIDVVSGISKKSVKITQNQQILTLTAEDVEDLDKIYIPREFNYDLMKSNSTWSFCRSKQSEHFIVFWESNMVSMDFMARRWG